MSRHKKGGRAVHGPALQKSFFAGRRSQLFSLMAPESVAIVLSNPEQNRSNDTEFPYRQSSDVLYLSDFPEPESVLVLSNVGGKERFCMFVRPKDPAKETWTGRRAGVEGAQKLYGAQSAFSINDFEKEISGLIADAERVYYRFGINTSLDEKFRKVWLEEQVPLFSTDALIHPLRLVKTEAELELMRYAADVSAMAHVEAMRLMRPGLFEHQVEATLRSVFGFNGAPAEAYTSIVAGGNNAVILHYTENNAPLESGDLVLIDAGCEFRGYASDITRTFPVSGRFSEAQAEIYQLVLDANLAGIRAAKPGSSINKVHRAASDTLRRGLVKLGVLPAEMARKASARKLVSEARKAGELADLAWLGRYFMHGTSHWMGLDVHDVSGDSDSRNRPFEPGMVFTVEPGLYFDADDRLVPEKYRGIGIRIEDDVVITEDGCSIITSGVPKSISEIEKLMADGQAHCASVQELLG